MLMTHSMAWQVRVAGNCLHNQYKALAERHIKDRSYVGFDRRVFLQATRKPLNDLWQSLDFTKVGLASLEDVVAAYSGGKRRMYERAKEVVETVKFNRKWSKVRMFVKPDKRDICQAWEKVPRAIQYRRPEFNILMAQYLRPLEEKLFGWVDDEGLRRFAKCRNLQQRAADILKIHSKFKDAVVLSTDHSKFDSHVTVDHLKRLHKFYLKVHPSKFLFRLLRCQINNSGFSVQGLKYHVRGTRMSGDYDTSLGNCLLNYLVLMAWLDMCGIKGHVYVDGDDALVFIERSDLDKINPKFFNLLGFQTDVEVCELNTFVFCQAKLIRSDPPTLARDPRKVLSNLQISLKEYTPSYWPKIFQGKLICEYWANQGVPYVIYYLQRLLNGKLEFRIPPEDLRRWTLVKDHVKARTTPQAYIDLLNAWQFGYPEASLMLTPFAYRVPVLHKSGPAAKPKHEWTSESLSAIKAQARWMAITCGPGCRADCGGGGPQVSEPVDCGAETIKHTERDTTIPRKRKRTWVKHEGPGWRELSPTEAGSSAQRVFWAQLTKHQAQRSGVVCTGRRGSQQNQSVPILSRSFWGNQAGRVWGNVLPVSDPFRVDSMEI